MEYASQGEPPDQSRGPRSDQDKPETVLVDTTYLLPIFGGKVDLPGFNDVLPSLLSRMHVVYSPVSLIECKWVVLRLARRSVRGTGTGKESATRILRAYYAGLSLLASGQGVPTQLPIFTSSRIESISDILFLDFGITDYFDRMIYATASEHSFALLTEDSKLHDLQKEMTLSNLGLKPRRTMAWRDIRSEMLK